MTILRMARPRPTGRRPGHRADRVRRQVYVCTCDSMLHRLMRDPAEDWRRPPGDCLAHFRWRRQLFRFHLRIDR